MEKKQNRSPGLDVIRCVALLCVISVHFFLRTDFYSTPVTGIAMFAMIVLRNSFMICVPLFMMLTGYLVTSKELSKKYYIKLVRVLFVYVLASLFCALYKMFVQKTGLSVFGMILHMFAFENAPYSWYVEMYIGLFLMIPFLNILYDGLQTQKKKQVLLITLLILTALPKMMNAYCASGLGWWLRPSSSQDYVDLVPDMWVSMYPITYFYLGRYLREFPLKLKPGKIFLCAIAVFGLAGLYNCYRSYGSCFVSGPWQSYSSFFITAQSVLVFSFFTSLRYERLPVWTSRVFARASDLSLGAYLVSWIFDMIVYGKLNSNLTTMEAKLPWMPVTVLVVLICSLLLSQVIDWLYRLTAKRWVDRVTKREKTV